MNEKLAQRSRRRRERSQAYAKNDHYDKENTPYVVGP